jgi:uncharacterized protein (DUF2062 family)
MNSNHSIVVGIAGGTFLSIVPNIQSEDILKTVLLATLGAVVSFFISVLLKLLLKKHNK